jgi:hypothetical protein
MTKNANAVELGRRGGKKGGRARAEALTAEERSAIARAAADVRWAAKDGDDAPTRPKLLKATHQGILKIGAAELPCAVLEDGRRVLTQEGFSAALGRKGNLYRRAHQDFDLPPFLTAANLKPFISDELRDSSRPIVFKTIIAKGVGNVPAYGYAAELLPRVCQVFLDARDADALLKSQEHIARACDLLVRGLATVGILALVDEATGYQYERDRDALHKILEAYIAKELLPWAQRFPHEFYKQMFRLRGWTYSPMSVRGPLYAGTLVNKLVYERLPEGVLNELCRKNPVTETGRRKHRHHQFLTETIGHPHLEKHVSAVTALMRASRGWSEFADLFQRAFPARGDQIPLELTARGEPE